MASIFDFAFFSDRLTDHARDALSNADNIARSFGSTYIGTEHLLLGILHTENSVGAKLLSSKGITYDRARVALNLTPKSLTTRQAKGLSETAKLTLKMSWDIAQEYNQEFCGTEHILFSLLSQKNSRALTLLDDMSIPMVDVQSEIENYLGSQQDEFERGASKTTHKGKKVSALDFFGTDLTAEARKGKIDPLIGRDSEVERMITILARRNKHNPVLVGEPGVGKTAIVEGLATKIAQEEVPEQLLDKRIISLDLAGMIAGTKYRGEFEGRLKQVLRELSENPNIIIFIDEMHLLVGAGAAEGAIDAGNMLKPALARGKLKVVGATTSEEYRKHIEPDAALERRFQPIQVKEPNEHETLAILRGLKKHYESFHNVVLEDEILEYAQILAGRYIHDRNYPDKAIDLLDEAAARARILRAKVPVEQMKLKKAVSITREKLDEAAETENYERAALLKTRLTSLEEKYEALAKKTNKKQRLTIVKDDIAEVVAIATGVPVTKLIATEAKQLLNLEKRLAKYVIGQDEALHEVSKAIRRNRSGISAENRPIGSFVFLGPSGVGKTETARVLAKEMYDDVNRLVKIDMSEFSERHTVARLVGAPAGYVGYDAGGQLTEKIRKQPYSLLLLDEIEKAHPEVFNLLLQILEDGVLTDAKGRKVDFSNTLIIMTSNIGSEVLQKEARFGFHTTSVDDKKELKTMHEQTAEKVTEELKGVLLPELINRIDKQIVFKALTRDEASRIVGVQFDQLRARLMKNNIALRIKPNVKKFVLDKGYSELEGVRPLRRVIQDHIEDALSQALLEGTIHAGATAEISARKTGIVVSKSSE